MSLSLIISSKPSSSVPSTNKVCLPILRQAVCQWKGFPQEKHPREQEREAQLSGATSSWTGNGRGAGAMGPGALAVVEAVVLKAT